MKLIALLMGFFLSVAGAFSQPPPEFREKRAQVEAQKAAFMTVEMNLTTEEAQRFWPEYNAYTEALAAVRVLPLLRIPGIESPESLAPDEWEALMKQRFADRRKEIEVEEQYYARFQKILPPEKVAAFYLAEEKFKRQLFRQAQERKGR